MRFVEKPFAEPLGPRLVERQFIGPRRVPKRLKTGLGLLHADAGFETSHERKPKGLVIVETVASLHPGYGHADHAEGSEETGLFSPDRGIEVGRRDAKNCEGVAVHKNDLAYYIARSPESRLP